jgi:hypothetical protein
MNLHFLLWLAAGFTSLANATSFYIRPLPEFARDARYIVRGTIHSVTSDYGSDATGTKTLYTYAKLEVREVLKGTLTEREILIRKAGGTKDGLTLSIESSPDFQENEDTVLFLGEPREDRAFEVEGLELGKFGLEESNGELFLKGGLLDYSRPRAGERAEALGPGIAENRRAWSLRDLRKTLGTGEPAPAPPIRSASSATESVAPALLPAPVEAPRSDGDAPFSDAAPAPRDPAKAAGLLVLSAGLIMGALFFYLRRK